MFLHACEGQRSVQVCVPQKSFTLLVFIYYCVCERHVYVNMCVILCGQSEDNSLESFLSSSSHGFQGSISKASSSHPEPSCQPPS